MVIKLSAAHLFLFQIKTQWLDEMQVRATVGTQTNDVTRIGCDFGFVESDIKHNGWSMK